MANAHRLPSGNWRVKVYVGKTPEGKKIEKSFTAPTRREAEFLAAQYLADSSPTRDCDLTLGQAIDNYIASKDAVLSPSTIAGYKRIRKNWLGTLEFVKLKDLTSTHLQKAVNDLSRGHSPKTVRNFYGLITTTYGVYMPDRKLSVTLPQKEHTEMIIPTVEELNILLDAVQDTPDELPILLAAFCGLRRSEIAALDLTKDVDYQNNRISITKAIVQDVDGIEVEKGTKAYASNRTIDAPPDVIEKLRDARDRGLVHPITLTSFSSRFSKIVRRLDLPHFRFHDLRHYYASVMLRLGVPDKYAMKRMGHSTPNMLKTVYQHIMQDKDDEVTDTINAYFDSVRHKNRHEE